LIEGQEQRRSNNKLKWAIKEIVKKFEITNEGNMDEYLRVKIEKQKNSTIKMYQPHLITQILDILGYNESTKAKTPQQYLAKNHTGIKKSRICKHSGRSIAS